MDLAMAGKDEKTKIKLFLYLIGSKGREIYETLSFTREPDDRNLSHVLEGFEAHCNPKKNETVERYKFFQRFQEPGEPFERFVTDLKVLASTCNFGTLKDSLVRDRIICGIRDKQLREDLLKERDLNLEKCLQTCRAVALSKDQSKTLEPDQGEVHFVKENQKRPPKLGRKLPSFKDDKDRVPAADRVPDANHRKKPKSKEFVTCKFCGNKHEKRRDKCPAFGKRCLSCKKMNHFTTQCRLNTKVNVVETDEDEDDEYCLTLESEIQSEVINSSSDRKHAKKLFATLYVDKSAIKFQLDSGATCNLVPANLLRDKSKLKATRKVLTMYNKTTVTPLGQCTLEVHNPKNHKMYQVDFVVVDGNRCMPILGSPTIQEMDLIKVQQHNILSVEANPVTQEVLLKDYPDVFQGTGKLEGQYNLEVREDVQPVVHPPRRVPVALKEKLKQELEKLQRLGVIKKVTEPTPWVSSLVTARKPNGQLRVCLDPKDLNEALKRSHYPTPTIDEILPELGRAKVFSTVDVKNGFWHVELTDESSMLTTFNSPFGRFRWCRLPFGVSPAPEEFQRRLNNALENLKGVLPIHDDILIYGEGTTEEEALQDHDRNLLQLMQRCKEKNIKLNKEKVKLRSKEVPFMGHVITSEGLKADPEKIRAVQEMPTPTDVAGVRRFIGFTNYLSKFLPRLSDVCAPLRQLTVQNTEWFWADIHDRAVSQVKSLVTQAPVLQYFDSTKGVTLQCDASDKGLGAVIMQNDQPIAYASRALTDAETRYAQIEKELLAVVYGLEKFHTYTYGRCVAVQSDHKPLEMIFKKSLHKAPKRLQRMLMRTQLYDIKLNYRRGSTMYLADTLSRAFLPYDVVQKTAEEFESVNMVEHIRVKPATLQEIRAHTEQDEVLQELMKVIKAGWPETKHEVPHQLTPFFGIRDELSMQDGIVLRGERVVIPKSLQRQMVNRVHYAHTGTASSLSRARECIYWPGMSTDVKHFIEKCDVCRAFDKRQSKETFIPHESPDLPWEKVGVDLFNFNGRDYLITVDYYSSFWEIDVLENTRSGTVIRKLKSQFARHGIPETCMSDNGSQFSSDEFREFSHQWNFKHNTSSPKYPQSNGKVEAAVKSAKTILKKSRKARTDPYLALLEYRNTPTQGMDTSPVMRLMSRQTRTQLPTMPKLLKPTVDENVYQKIMANKDKQAANYNKGAKDLPELQKGDIVRFIPPGSTTKEAVKARVGKQVGIRSYEVITEDGAQYRRNRKHLRKTKEDDILIKTRGLHAHTTPALPMTPAPREPAVATPINPSPDPTGHTTRSERTVTPHPKEPAVATPIEPFSQATGYKTRSGRAVKPPSYLQDFVTGH